MIKEWMEDMSGPDRVMAVFLPVLVLVLGLTVSIIAVCTMHANIELAKHKAEEAKWKAIEKQFDKEVKP